MERNFCSWKLYEKWQCISVITVTCSKGAGGRPGKVSSIIGAVCWWKCLLLSEAMSTGQIDKEHLLRSLLKHTFCPQSIASAWVQWKTCRQIWNASLCRPVQLSEPSPTFLRSYKRAERCSIDIEKASSIQWIPTACFKR